jgi:hypothetical protein
MHQAEGKPPVFLIGTASVISAAPAVLVASSGPWLARRVGALHVVEVDPSVNFKELFAGNAAAAGLL